MKKVLFIVLAFLIFCFFIYYVIFVRERRVKDHHLLMLSKNNKGDLVVEPLESFWYLKTASLQQTDDTTANLIVYKTTVYNVFSDKKFTIVIPINPQFKVIKVGDYSISVDSLIPYIQH